MRVAQSPDGLLVVHQQDGAFSPASRLWSRRFCGQARLASASAAGKRILKVVPLPGSL